MIFFRLRNNPQIPTKKRVKDTPKILNKLIGIFRLFLSKVSCLGWLLGLESSASERVAFDLVLVTV